MGIIAASFLKLVCDYLLYETRVFNTHLKKMLHYAATWSCPPEGIIKINVDAHFGAGTSGGLGAVARDHFGRILWVADKKTPMDWNVELAEVAAVRVSNG